MPEFLKDKYQNFTQANINSLRASGYNYDFFTLEEGVKITDMRRNTKT